MLPRRRPARLGAAALSAAALLGALVCIHARGARGEEGERRVMLRWSAPAECPAADRVVAEVDRLLGPGVARPPKPIEVAASVLRDDQGIWRVHLETEGQGPTRVRELKGASCAAIADATALILALMIDPTAVASAPPSSASASAPASASASAPASASAAPSASAPVPPAPPSAAGAATGTVAGAGTGSAAAAGAVPVTGTAPAPEGARASVPLRLLLWAGADVGSLPGVSPGLGGAFAVLWGPQRFEIGAAYRLPLSTSVSGRPVAGGDVDLIAGSLATCRSLLAQPVEIGPCAGFEIGRMHAKGFGVSNPGEGAALWTAIGAGGLVAWAPLRSLGFSLRLDAVVPLVRPRFVLENVGPVHRPGPIAGRAAAGVELRF